MPMDNDAIILTPEEIAGMTEPGRQNYLAKQYGDEEGDIGEIARGYLAMQKQYQAAALSLDVAEMRVNKLERLLQEMVDAIDEAESDD